MSAQLVGTIAALIFSATPEQISIEITLDTIVLPSSMAIINVRTIDGVGEIDLVNRDSSESALFFARLYTSKPTELAAGLKGVPGSFPKVDCFNSSEGLLVLQFEGRPDPMRSVVVIQASDFQLNLYGNKPGLLREVFDSVVIGDWSPCALHEAIQ